MRLAKVGVGVLVTCAAVGAAVAKESARTPWAFWGGDVKNTRHARAERTLSPRSVGSLAVKWVFQTAGNVTATPAVDERHVYFPDWGGYLHAVDRRTGVARWSHAISEYTGRASGVARATPAIAGDLLVFGDLGARAEGDLVALHVEDLVAAEVGVDEATVRRTRRAAAPLPLGSAPSDARSVPHRDHRAG